jgi:hypothetical protein
MKRERGKFKRIRKLREKGGNIKRKGNIRKRRMTNLVRYLAIKNFLN